MTSQIHRNPTVSRPLIGGTGKTAMGSSRFGAVSVFGATVQRQARLPVAPKRRRFGRSAPGAAPACWERLCCVALLQAETAMALPDILKHDQSALDGYTIEQVVAICGDGKLGDGSKSSDELRHFLGLRSPTELAAHANYCLENKFERSGFILQDIVNEIGRRLGYVVTNGLYKGKANAVGFDGLWNDGENDLIIEVKTTDAYRINLDRLFSYGEKLDAASGEQARNRYSLIVVGRQDTGDLEAQVRGSRHAWSVRMVSVEALTKLMFVNAELEDQTLTDKIRRVLLPFEYTRVDHIIDLVFETQQEADAIQETEVARVVDPRPNEGTESKPSTTTAYEFTPMAELDAKRLSVVRSLFLDRSKNIIRKSKTNFANDDDTLRVTCAVSKRYDKTYQPYWYALHPAWVEFLKGAVESYFVLGCMDQNEAYAIPYTVVQATLEKLNTSEKKNGTHYWHIALTEERGVLKWNLTKVGEKIDLSPYRFRVNSGSAS